MASFPLDSRRLAAHKRNNTVQTWAIAAGAVLLLAVTVWALFGLSGVFWAVLAGAIGLWRIGKISPQMVLRLYKARVLSDAEFAEGLAVVRELAHRAGLPSVPRLCYVQSKMMNAFAVGTPDDSAIAVTDGLLRGLNMRQLTGVLAHETAHIMNEDLKVMAMADVMNRIASLLSMLGFFALFLHMPFVLFSGPAPWLGILLLMAAPTVIGLLQLALSRTREYDADLGAAMLTGDPAGLASALQTLERRQGAMWEGLMLPGGRMPDPSLLRSHPKTRDRVAALMALHGERAAALPDAATLTPIEAVHVERPRIARSIVPPTGRPRVRVRSLGLYW